MPRLTFASHLLENQAEVIAFHFEGSLDFFTVSKFETFAKMFLDQGLTRMICDFSNVSEIQEGEDRHLAVILASLLTRDADIKSLLNVSHSAIHTWFESLRHQNESLKVFGNLDEALKDFFNGPRTHHFQIKFDAQEVVAGLPFILVIEACDDAGQLVSSYAGTPHLIVDRGMISPVLAQPFRKGRWEGDAILTSAGDVKVRVRDENAVGETVIQAVEKGELAKFPIKIRCPGCRQENVAGKNDIFRCMDCNEIYYVDKFGHVISLKPGRARSNGFIRHLEFKIPSDVNYLNHIRNFIVGISSEERINDEKIAQIEMSLDEALANVIEHAYAYDAFQEIHISLTLYPDKLIVVIRDHGRSFDSKNLPLPDLKKHIEERRVGGLGRYLIKTLMDEVEYQSDSYTNELRMVKHF